MFYCHTYDSDTIQWLCCLYFAFMRKEHASIDYILDPCNSWFTSTNKWSQHYSHV